MSRDMFERLIPQALTPTEVAAPWRAGKRKEPVFFTALGAKTGSAGPKSKPKTTPPRTE